MLAGIPQGFPLEEEMLMLAGRIAIVAGLLALCAGPLAAAPIVLYDASAGGGTQTPDNQGFLYLTSELFPDATKGASGGLTDLDTTPDQSESAGWFTHNPFTGAQVHPMMPVLDRSVGYTVTFDLQMIDEVHDARDDNGDGKFDRAGFSMIVISSDLKGLELGFFHDDAGQNEIWAYEDDTPVPGDMFTQAEGADRTAAQTGTLTRYDLTLQGDNYDLSAGGTTILSGALRDYTSFPGLPIPPFGTLDPYDKANLLFLGDDTGSARSHVRLGDISVTLIPEPATAVVLCAGFAAALLRRRRR
jgi:hypothetical protein